MKIWQITDFLFKLFSIKYLGYPLYCGRRKKEYFARLCQAVVLKIDSWKNRLLSFGERIVLLKHVLSSLPVYLLMVASPSKIVFKEIESMFSNFLWGSSEGGPKFSWIR